MLMSSFQPRAEYQPPQPRLSTGGNGYNRRNNRHHQQNKTAESKDQNGVPQQQQQPQAMTNGVASTNGEEAPVVEQLNQLSIKQESAAPITA